MRCGWCKESDVTIDHVKACSDRAYDQRSKEPFAMPEPSDAQVSYVLGLQESRELPEEADVLTETQLRKMDRAEVSRKIQELKLLPFKPPTGHGKASVEVPSGRFALYVELEDEASRSVASGTDPLGAWQFYKVDRPEKGRWAGYTFVKRLIGAPGDYREVPMQKNERSRVLTLIAKDPRQAAVDFGKQTNHCGRCMSPLTHKRSRAAGYGQKCASVMGWPW